MAIVEIKTDPSRREIRVFGLLWLLFFAAIAALEDENGKIEGTDVILEPITGDSGPFFHLVARKQVGSVTRAAGRSSPAGPFTIQLWS